MSLYRNGSRHWRVPIFQCNTDTLTRAAKLIAFGIPFTDLIQKTFYEKSFNETRASAYAISKAAQLLDGFFVWSYMETKEMERFHITSAELDSVVSELRNIRGVDTAVFLYENRVGCMEM